MKRFKTRKKYNKKWLIIGMLLFFILFIWISFYELKTNNEKYVTFLLSDAKILRRDKKILPITSNLDLLLKKCFFSNKNNISYNILPTLHLQINNEKDSVSMLTLDLLKKNFKKVGINTSNEKDTSYYVKIELNKKKAEDININGKIYATLSFVLNNDYYRKDVDIMDKYLKNNYNGISTGINFIEDNDINNITIKMNYNDNIQNIKNSTEIIALMFYHLFGDKNEKSN